MEYEIFVKKWLERSEKVDRSVDKGDNFIDLWISFNGWMKSKFGEKKRDGDLIDSVCQLDEFIDIFNQIKNERPFSDDLLKLKGYTVKDMREPDNESRRREYDDSFESLIRTIYQIRCNLFHGRKNFEEDKNDFELVCLAYNILLPLFKKYLQSN